MAYFNFPHTRTYDTDLGWIIAELNRVKELLNQYLENAVITFADPITWNITEQYTALTMVIDNDGTAYLSKQPVPAGIDITNTDYWLPVFNYDDNIKELRSNIATLSSSVGVIPSSLDAGRLIWYDSNLYVTTTNLPAGAVITPGSNANKTTVEEYILSRVSVIEEDITDLNTAIGDVRNDLTETQNDLTETQNDVTEIREDLTNATTRLDNLKTLGHYIVFCTTDPTLNPAGHCSFITHEDHAFLFDMGRYSAYPAISAALKKYGITTIDGILISHYHRDHDGWPDSGNYDHWKADFNMDNTVFYIPLNPPSVVGTDWSSDTLSILRGSFPLNTFIQPPAYGSFTWEGYTITAFNNTAEDYAYYAAQNVRDYNMYSQIVYIERNGVRVLNMGDAGGVAQNHCLYKFKSAIVMTAPHHAINGDGLQQVADIVKPHYVFASDPYFATTIGYRDPLLTETMRNGAVMYLNSTNWPYEVSGNMDDFQTLEGSASLFGSNYDCRRKIYINETIGDNAYQDGSAAFPFKSWRMIGALAKDLTEVVLLSDVSGLTLYGGSGFIIVTGNGHKINGYIELITSIHAVFRNVTFNSFVMQYANVIFENCSITGTNPSYFRESVITSPTALAHSQPLNYRNSFISINGTAYTGSGSIA